MLKENEVVMLVLGIGVMFLILLNRAHLRKIKFWKILFYGYCILLCGWFFTVTEVFLLEQYLNILEHISYAISAVLFMIWAWKATGSVVKEDV
jgi:hypothetical protein